MTTATTTPANPLANRHRSTIVSINGDVVTVRPIARKLATMEPVRVTLLPLSFPYRASAGCEGVLMPAANGNGYEFKPSRRDSHLTNLRPPKVAKIKAPKAAKAKK